MVPKFLTLVATSAATPTRTISSPAPVSPKTASSAATLVAKTAAPVTAAATALGFRASLRNIDILTFQILVVHTTDCCKSLIPGWHLHKSESSRFTTDPVSYNIHGYDFPEGCESSAQIIFAYIT